MHLVEKIKMVEVALLVLGAVVGAAVRDVWDGDRGYLVPLARQTYMELKAAYDNWRHK